MVPVFTMPDEQFAACAGYDALTYVNFLKLCLRLTLWVSVIMGVMVLPTNLAAGNFIEQQLDLQDTVLLKLQARDPPLTLEACEDVQDGADAEEVLAQVRICAYKGVITLPCMCTVYPLIVFVTAGRIRSTARRVRRAQWSVGSDKLRQDVDVQY